MTNTDNRWREQFRKEADDVLFAGIELSERAKRNIRQQAALEKPATRRRIFFPRKWAVGMVAIAAAIAFIAVLPTLQQSSAPAPQGQVGDSSPPASGGAVGSDLSSLITVPLSSDDEARAAFGAGLLLPAQTLEGFALTDRSAAGAEGEPARDIIYNYMSGERTMTFSASRMQASYPSDLFAPVQVNGADGMILAQEGYTELFWTVDGVQYGVSGQITEEEALKVAESIE